jgi:hypothetical protein
LLVHVAIEREAGLLDEAQGGNRGHELGKRSGLIQRVRRGAAAKDPRPVKRSAVDQRDAD